MQSRLESIAVTRENGIAVVAMNRPHKRNAMNLLMLDELVLALADVEHAPEVSAVVFTGHGAVFSAGADRSAVAGLSDEELTRAFAAIATDLARGVARLMLRLVAMTKPVIGAINGHAVGGAFIATLGCDLRVASQDASFWMPELGMGRAIGAPSMATLVACVGPLVAKDIVLGGQRLTARDAAALGLVSRTVPAAEVMSAATAAAATLASADAAAFATAKARANAGLVEIWRQAAECPGDAAD